MVQVKKHLRGSRVTFVENYLVPMIRISSRYQGIYNEKRKNFNFNEEEAVFEAKNSESKGYDVRITKNNFGFYQVWIAERLD